MANKLDLDQARLGFSEAIARSKIFPETLQITIRSDPELGEAAVFHCQWPLTEKGPYSGDLSRMITVQIASGAVTRFCDAEPRERGAMGDQLVRVIRVTMAREGYNPKDPPNPPLLVHIDQHALEP